MILLVEDDPDHAMLLRRSLCRAGVGAIHVVETGEDAIAYLKGEGRFRDRDEHPVPRLVLLDLKLPRLSGLEVLEWLREQPGLRRTPVVLFSSSDDPADLARAYDLGANSFLVKPHRFSDLEDMASSLAHYWLVLNEAADIA